MIENSFYFTKKVPFVFSIFVLRSSPLFSFLGHCWFYRRGWFLINSKVYVIIMSLNWILKTQIFNVWRSKVLILVFGQLIEYFIEKIFMEKFDYPKSHFVPLHWQGDSFIYSMLITEPYLIWSKNHRKAWNKVVSQRMAKHVHLAFKPKALVPELMQLLFHFYSIYSIFIFLISS